MAEPRKVPFVTISPFSAPPPPPPQQQQQQQQTPEPNKKRRREDEAADVSLGKDGGGGAAAVGSGGSGGLFGSAKGGDADSGEAKPTVRLNLTLSEPNEKGSSEFNYGELVQPTAPQVKPAGSTVPKGLAPPLDPSDPFADDEKERREVEELARKFESKYGSGPKKKKKDRMQDLIDIGYGYDETDPFIDNSEAYDELVPASLTTKHGGFYINTGTLQFRAASDSEGENAEDQRFKKMKDGEERVIKKRRKKQDGGILEDKKPRKNKVPKPGGGSVLGVHRPEKKKRKKLMKDSLHLANMLRRFTREKEEMRKKNLATAAALPRPSAKAPGANSAVGAHPKAAGPGNDCNITDLTDDQAVMSLLGSANNDLLQDMMGDLDFGMLDSPQPGSPSQGENGAFGSGQKTARLLQGSVMTPPPPLPCGLPGPLSKRIEDLRAASRQFDEEGRKKFFTLDMNNILLDIELQVQEQPVEVRSAVYSHLEAFVPCNKEALLKRLKKLSLNVQDDRLRAPLLNLKLAVCSVMPEQIARYNMDCIAKVAKQQSEEGDKNGSEDDDEEKPGKRVMGPRKKFIWDDKLRSLLCNLVQVKLGFYELEGKNSLSLEDYLKAFMETEVKPLWPKGWMQARMLFKESTMVHGHLTGFTAKKKMVPTPKAKPKEVTWVQRPTPPAGVTPSPAAQVAKRPPQSPPGTICLDSLDESPSLDSISQALAILGNAAKGLAQGDTPPSPERPKTSTNAPSLHASPLLQPLKKNSVSTPSSSTPHYISTSSSASTSLPRPAPNTSSPLTSARVEGTGVVKGTPQPNRHTVLNTQRPLSVGVTKAAMPVSVSPPKPRPPPTASPLVAPGPKTGVSISPSGLLKGSNNKATSGDTIIITSTQSRPHTLTSPSLIVNKTFQTSRLAQTPQNKPPTSLPQTPSAVQPQPQSNFITPMHATLTKSAHSSIPPIVKLTPRTPNPAVAPSTTSIISASISQTPRSQAAPSIHQYTPKTPAGFRPPFSGATGGVAKSGQGSYTPSSGQKTPSVISATNTSLINTSSMSKHSGSSASPAAASVTPGQRQRTVGGTPQGAKPVVSLPLSSVSSQLPQVSTTGSGGLLASGSSLALGYGMLGGLVPVSLPFQFPSMLNLSQLGTGGSSTPTSSSAASSSAAFSTLTQNVSQSQGSDTKRKTL
ncbi:ubinuclein-2 isoform X2 [Fundulus heteroclitus]|uniref:ubinuclein-2 isoform X2 n=1 Tax=Fundulus heteroclitus TaxID=8078 RepID=UPI00165AAA90|nr:ubinuclein-2 isoform X2 [Fundulus heteroclitus]